MVPFYQDEDTLGKNRRMGRGDLQVLKKFLKCQRAEQLGHFVKGQKSEQKRLHK
jgi:hypothetical protein